MDDVSLTSASLNTLRVCGIERLFFGIRVK